MKRRSLFGALAAMLAAPFVSAPAPADPVRVQMLRGCVRAVERYVVGGRPLVGYATTPIRMLDSELRAMLIRDCGR